MSQAGDMLLAPFRNAAIAAGPLMPKGLAVAVRGVEPHESEQAIGADAGEQVIDLRSTDLRMALRLSRR